MSQNTHQFLPSWKRIRVSSDFGGLALFLFAFWIFKAYLNLYMHFSAVQGWQFQTKQLINPKHYIFTSSSHSSNFYSIAETDKLVKSKVMTRNRVETPGLKRYKGKKIQMNLNITLLLYSSVLHLLIGKQWNKMPIKKNAPLCNPAGKSVCCETLLLLNCVQEDVQTGCFLNSQSHSLWTSQASLCNQPGLCSITIGVKCFPVFI